MILFECDCGKFKKQWIDPTKSKLCPFCNSILREVVLTGKQTKIMSFLALSDEELNERHKLILNGLKELKTANNREIAEHIRLPINAVTPRVLELREGFRINKAGTKQDEKTNRKTICWQITNITKELEA